MAIRRAVVAAAGLGTRLRPLTGRWAKPALPFLGRPLLHRIFEALEGAGVREVCLNLHHRPSTVLEAARRYGGPLRLRWFYEPEIRGTAGLLPPMARALGEEPFYVVNGDTLGRPPLASLDAALEADGEALLALAVRPLRPPFTPLSVDGRGRVTALGTGGHHFAGAYAARPGALAAVPPEGFAGFVETVLSPAIAQGRVLAVPADGPWEDLGTPGAFLTAALAALSGEGDFSVPPEAEVRRCDDFPVFLHRDGLLHPGAEVTGPLVVEAGAVVPRGARAGRAVLFPGFRGREGERLEDGLFWPGGRIEVPGTEAVGSCLSKKSS